MTRLGPHPAQHPASAATNQVLLLGSLQTGYKRETQAPSGSPQGCHCDQSLLLTWCLAFTLLLKLSPWPWLTFQQKINAPSSVSSLPLENNLSGMLKGCVAEDYRASGGQDGTFPFSSTENQKHELPSVYKGENILLPETSLFNNGTIRRPI